mmetsp:Transcript_65412/g.98655  ORF Transcript_65412/g.98655 Transcript_65412/m.98655 type:complete len:155 (-) Transcript_65412:146-610(-)
MDLARQLFRPTRWHRIRNGKHHVDRDGHSNDVLRRLRHVGRHVLLESVGVGLVVRALVLHLRGVIGNDVVLLPPPIDPVATEFATSTRIERSIIVVYGALRLCVWRTDDWIRSKSGGAAKTSVLVVAIRCFGIDTRRVVFGHDAPPKCGRSGQW